MYEHELDRIGREHCAKKKNEVVWTCCKIEQNRRPFIVAYVTANRQENDLSTCLFPVSLKEQRFVDDIEKGLKMASFVRRRDGATPSVTRVTDFVQRQVKRHRC